MLLSSSSEFPTCSIDSSVFFWRETIDERGSWYVFSPALPSAWRGVTGLTALPWPFAGGGELVEGNCINFSPSDNVKLAFEVNGFVDVSASFLFSDCLPSPSLSSSVVLGENWVQLSVISIILKLFSMLFSAWSAESCAVIWEFSSSTHDSTVSSLVYLSVISWSCVSNLSFDASVSSELTRNSSRSIASFVSIASDNSISSLAFWLSRFFLASSISFFSCFKSLRFCWSSSSSSSFRICSFKIASFCVWSTVVFARSDSHSLTNELISLFMHSFSSISAPISSWFFSCSSARCASSDFKLEIFHSNSRLVFEISVSVLVSGISMSLELISSISIGLLLKASLGASSDICWSVSNKLLGASRLDVSPGSRTTVV